MSKIVVEGLLEIERVVIEKILERESAAAQCVSAQLNGASVTKREYTGAGFFTHFAISSDKPLMADMNGPLGDVRAEVSGLEHGAGFLLLVAHGRASVLEGFTYGESWPDVAEIIQFI